MTQSRHVPQAPRPLLNVEACPGFANVSVRSASELQRMDIPFAVLQTWILSHTSHLHEMKYSIATRRIVGLQLS